MVDQTDYAISADDAEWLAGATMLTPDTRREVMSAMMEHIGPDRMAALFSEFIGLANSVCANAAEMVSLQRIIDGHEHPDRESDRVNLPTPFGALQGIILASEVDALEACGGCAFRLGTIANQSPITTADADYCSDPLSPPFMCHEHMDDQGNPTRGCAGFAKLRAARKAEAHA